MSERQTRSINHMHACYLYDVFNFPRRIMFIFYSNEKLFPLPLKVLVASRLIA